ncbi:hypothetical protein NKI48_10420 [Mesorhizobium sp. M0644]|uniref:hypothetical protein n=1 Tax=unclassified Mesorhizobium TaxID=325217 RepID=UPI0012EC9D78|nr:hypothetical protein [Mesorhizobium sp. LSJC280B00]
MTVSYPRRGSDLSFEIALETVPVELLSNFVSLFFLIVLPDRSAQADVTSVLTTLFFSCATAAVDTAITIAAQTIVNLIDSPLEHRKNVVGCFETPAKAVFAPGRPMQLPTAQDCNYISCSASNHFGLGNGFPFDRKRWAAGEKAGVLAVLAAERLPILGQRLADALKLTATHWLDLCSDKANLGKAST